MTSDQPPAEPAPVCPRCGQTVASLLSLSGVCPDCSRRAAEESDTRRLFDRQAVRNRRTIRRSPRKR